MEMEMVMVMKGEVKVTRILSYLCPRGRLPQSTGVNIVRSRSEGGSGVTRARAALPSKRLRRSIAPRVQRLRSFSASACIGLDSGHYGLPIWRQRATETARRNRQVVEGSARQTARIQPES